MSRDYDILAEHAVDYRTDGCPWEQEANHFDEFCDQHELKSFWSCYGLGIRMDKPVPFPVEGKTIVYERHWGTSTIKVKIEGQMWGDLYIAADRAIRLSGDDHHVYIENLDEYEFDENDEIELITGS